ncbi:hypothetical protein P5673_022864 [Acropora cervicornis]|uniref:Uncharacterized protein n=1 Tax=Acropora cervicornis TaxID=6130 RepID=A0AAD9Q6H1_ACRCE|nr:hypothetical protein P5673_022864 [Acropora cervicornis]
MPPKGSRRILGVKVNSTQVTPQENIAKRAKQVFVFSLTSLSLGIEPLLRFCDIKTPLFMYKPVKCPWSSVNAAVALSLCREAGLLAFLDIIAANTKTRLKHEILKPKNSCRNLYHTHEALTRVYLFKQFKPAIKGRPSENSVEESNMSPPVPAATAALNLAMFVLQKQIDH